MAFRLLDCWIVLLNYKAIGLTIEDEDWGMGNKECVKAER